MSVHWTWSLLRPQERCEILRTARLLYVCLSASIIYHKPHFQTSWNFLYTLPVVVDQSSCDDNPIRYVHPVLWMPSCFHILVHRVYGEAYGRGVSVSGGQRREGRSFSVSARPSLHCLLLSADWHSLAVSLAYTTEFGYGGEQCVAHALAKSGVLGCLVTVARDRVSDSEDCYVLVVIFIYF